MIDLENVTAALAAEPAVQLAVVFGSVARERSSPQSDLDLGLLLDPDSRELRRRVEVAAGRAARRDTQVVYLDEAPPLLRWQIARYGKVLVEQRPRLWVRFKERAMIDWWDWAPTARRIHEVYLRRLREEVANG